MPPTDPAIGRILVQQDDLAHRVRALGEQISADYAGRDLFLVGVLKGAFFFLSDLMRSLDVNCEVDFMAVASYGSETDSSGVVRILKDLDASIEGRDVLTVRAWQDGDRMRPLGLGGTKSLQDVFTDKKVPREMRRTLPVVVAGNGEIAWVAGAEVVGEQFRAIGGQPTVALSARRRA